MGSETSIRESSYFDVGYVAARMREADRIEVAALSGKTPYEALMQGYEKSDMCFTGLVEDEPCCMFGFSSVSMLSDAGVPWLLGTDLIHAIPVQFLRKSKEMVDAVWATGVYSSLENWIDAKNEASLAWLPWLGFEIIKTDTLEKGGRTFYRFRKLGE